MYPYWSYFTHLWPEPGEPAGAGHPDEKLAHRVADRLIADPAVRGGNLEISVQNRVVILTGRIDSATARDAAGRQAWSAPGVHDVCNRLVVGP